MEEPGYLQLLLDIPNLSPIGLLTFFLLAFFRLAPIAATCPFLGAKVIPTIAKAGLAFFLSIIFLPTVIATSSEFVGFNTAFIGYSLKEMLIGLVIAFLSNIPFFIVESAGSIIDYERGASQLMSQDPTMKVQASSIGIMYNYIMIAIFFMLDGPMYFFDIVATSFEAVPVDGLIHAGLFNLNNLAGKFSLNIMAHIFAMSIQMAAPAIVGILMAETFLGIANRLAPQVQIAFLGMPLKSLLGILVIWVGWFIILKQFGKQAMDYFEEMMNLIKTIPLLNIQ